MKKIILWFYKCSIGELNVALPILKSIKDNDPKVKIFLIFQTKRKYKDIPEIYKIISKELGNIIIGSKQFYKTIIRNKQSNAIIITCTSGHTDWTKATTKIIKKNKILFNHHAYSFKGRFNLNDFFSKYKQSELKKTYKNSYIILNEKESLNYYKQLGFEQDKILISSALGYKKKWLNYLILKREKYYNIIKRIQDKNPQNTYLVTTRGPHKNYLTKKNYKYLIESIFWLAKNNKRDLFMLKPHPRQEDEKYLQKQCELAPNKNIILVEEPITILAKLADLTISFWSSSIADSLSVGTLAIEFHRHEIEHFELIRNKNNDLISLYVHKGFCPHIKNKEDLQKFINNKKKWNKLKENSIKNFKLVYLLNDETENKFLLKIQELFKETKSIKKTNTNFKDQIILFKSIITAILRTKIIKILSVLKLKKQILKILTKLKINM
jgi:hypothetical protein